MMLAAYLNLTEQSLELELELDIRKIMVYSIKDQFQHGQYTALRKCLLDISFSTHFVRHIRFPNITFPKDIFEKCLCYQKRIQNIA